MFHFIKKLESRVNGISIIILFFVFFGMLNVINGKYIGVAKLKQITNGVGILDMEPGYTVEKAYNILEKQGPEGRSYYLKRIIPLDFIFPLTYMFFYASILLYLLKRLHFKQRFIHFIFIIPILAAICDYLENISILRLLIYYPQKLNMTVNIANIFTVAKFTFNFLSVAAILILILLNLIDRFRKVGSQN